MRIAGTSYTDSMVSQINLLAAQQYQLQNQATTGQRIRAPGDDPAGMEQALNLQTESSSLTQYAANISALQDRANLTASSLQQLQTLSNNVSSIVVQATSQNNSPDSLPTFASQVNDAIKQAVAIVNQKNGDQYLFGGTQSSQPPYSITTDANGNVTAVTFNGNAGTAQSQIAANTSVSVDIPGENTSGSGARALVTDSRYGADFFNHLISLANHLRAGDTASIASTDQAALTKDEDNIIYQVASNGVTLSHLDAAAAATSTQQSNVQKNITKVAGADLTQTLVDLNQASNSYQVALQTSSTIMKLQQSLLSVLP